MRPNVFISYRRADNPLIAHFLQRELAGRFGEESIFLDRSIDLGDNYVQVLQEAVGSCDVLVAIIGPAWLTMTHADGGRRLDREDDWVRIEIATALGRGIRVIPVLVAGAKPFGRDDLPEALAELADRQALFLDPAGLSEGIERLAKVVAASKAAPPRDLDDLVRRARLLKAEAEELLVAHARDRGGAAFDDLHPRPALEKMEQAMALLRQANALEPSDTEVLLLMADLLVDLTPDDPTDEQELASRVRTLLAAPKNDQERFRLARATFLLGVSGDPIQPDLVTDARGLFDRLGRNDWVRQCDDVIEGLRHDPPPRPQEFVPHGRWTIRDMAPVASTLTADFAPSGLFQGRFQAPGIGVDAPAQGQWAYNRATGAFQVQGIAGGFMPLTFLVFVQGRSAQGWFGTGSDGVGYVFSPV